MWHEPNLWQAVPRAGHNLKELRDGVQEIEDLGKKEEEQRFGEMPMDAAHREGHSCETNALEFLPKDHYLRRRYLQSSSTCRRRTHSKGTSCAWGRGFV